MACRCRAKVGHLICSSRSSGRSTCQIKLSGNSSTMVRQLRYHALHCVHKRPVCAIVTTNRSKFKRHLATTTTSQCHLQLYDFRCRRIHVRTGILFLVSAITMGHGVLPKTPRDWKRLQMVLLDAFTTLGFTVKGKLARQEMDKTLRARF